MLSRILVPMDDSDPAERALAYALDNHPDAEVTVIHVVGVPSMMMGEAVALSIEEDINAAASDRAAPVFERARALAEDRGRAIKTIVGIGHPARNILERADKYDTIIIGRHGADRERVVHRFLVGNISETVAKRAPVPVTMIH